jgi:hypothetical protein
MPSDIVLLDRDWPPGRPRGGSICQIGGWPNLPPDWSWPGIRLADGSHASLDFLAQIDLAELPHVSQRHLLPANGTLYFFALALSHLPLADFGGDATRVLYFNADARGFAQRPPPVDAGWNLDELHHVRTVAADFRRPEAPRGELFPRCPITPIAATADESDGTILHGGAKPAPSTFKYRDAKLPLRVEDALLHINFARNAWRENIVPFAAMRAHFVAAGHAHLEFERDPPEWVRDRRARPRPFYVDNVISDEFWPRYEAQYQDWRGRAVALSNHLAALGRPIVLTEEQRAFVRTIVGEADILKKQVSAYGLQFDWRRTAATKASLHTLLLDHPELADQYPAEILSAHPLQPNASHVVRHRMLGPTQDVQGGTMDGPNPVLLLQLDTDLFGPRLSWWDGGNLTIWISAEDATALRFDQARAEIEGH